jgi:hypothetical protein
MSLDRPPPSPQLRSFALALALAAATAPLVACTDTVHVKLERKDCDDSDFAPTADSGSSGGIVFASFRVELRRLDGVGVQRCLDIHRALSGLDDLQGVLAQLVAFDDLPTGGTWTMWVQGYPDPACTGVVSLCGLATLISLPPEGGTITIPVVCASPFSSDIEKLKALKECFK